MERKIRHIETREAASYIFALLAVLLFIFAVVMALKFVLMSFGLYSWLTLGVSFGLLFIVLVSIAILISIKGAKTDVRK